MFQRLGRGFRKGAVTRGTVNQGAICAARQTTLRCEYAITETAMSLCPIRPISQNLEFYRFSMTNPSSRLHRMAMETTPVLLAWEEASFFGSLMREGQCFTAARRSLSIIAMPMPCSNIGSAMISSTPSLSSSRST